MATRVNRDRNRNYSAVDNDRLKRALLQPVQPWDKKWTTSKYGKGIEVHKWVKSDRQLIFEEADDEDVMQVEEPHEDPHREEDTVASTIAPSQPIQPIPRRISATSPTTAPPDTAITTLEPENPSSPMVPTSTSLFTTTQTAAPVLEEEEATHTPNLEDVSDVEPEDRDGDGKEDDLEPVVDVRKQHWEIESERRDSLAAAAVRSGAMMGGEETQASTPFNNDDSYNPTPRDPIDENDNDNDQPEDDDMDDIEKDEDQDEEYTPGVYGMDVAQGQGDVVDDRDGVVGYGDV